MTKIDQPFITTDGIIFSLKNNKVSVLLIKRSNEPFKDYWAFPGGFIDPYEKPIEACLREIEEETSLKLNYFDAIEISTRSKKGRDPRGWTITLPFVFILKDECPSPQAADDAKEAKWINIEDISTLAFDHEAILCEAIAKLSWSLPKEYLRKNSYKIPSMKQYSCGQEVPTFYCGQYDPIHEGHLECMKIFRKKDQGPLILVPDQGPLKPIKNMKSSWSYYQHLLDFTTVIENLYVYPQFIGYENLNPTFKWLNMFPFSYNLLMGLDCFLSLPNWIYPEKFLVSTKKIYVIPRYINNQKKMNTIEIEKISNWCQSINSKMDICLMEEHEYMDLSSSKIRESSED